MIYMNKYNSTTNNIRHSDSVYRSCSRCGKELTDAASRESGQGPLCRAKNTEIFAKQIPAELTKASALILSLKPSDFHSDISEQFTDIQSKYCSKVEHMMSNHTGGTFILSGADFRKIVDWFDCALSYPISHNTRKTIIDFIEAIGYQTLAGILRGDVCMSPAKIYIENNMLVMEAKSNKHGWSAMRKSIPGIITPRYKGDKTPYKCNISYIKKFFDIANRYWPFNEPSEDFISLLEAFKQKMDSEAAVEDEKPLASLLEANSWIKVNLPWYGTKDDMFKTINKFKQISYSERNYDKTNNTWSFKAKYKDYIIDSIKDRYKITVST
jgi:hypothetical protein